MKRAKLKPLALMVLLTVLAAVFAFFCFGCSGEAVEGPAGERGEQGEQGEQGPKGEKGETGQSAYDIYVESLGEGETALTKAEWLESLKGENGLDGQCTITELEYVSSANGGAVGEKFDKWGIMHRLKITYLDAEREQQTVLSNDSLNIVDQSVFYEAETSDEIWRLIDFNVRRIRLTQDIVWHGNTVVQNKKDSTKQTLDIVFGKDVEFDLAGYTLFLDANLIRLGKENHYANVVFKNGKIRRITRESSDDRWLKEKDGEVLVDDAAFGASPSSASIHVQNNCSLVLDTVDFYSQFGGILADGMSASLTIKNNSIVKVVGYHAVTTNAANATRYDVMISLSDSEIEAVRYDINNNEVKNDGDKSWTYEGYAVYLNVPGRVDIFNCKLTGRTSALCVRGGTADVRNSVLTTSYGYNDNIYDEETKSWGNRMPNATVIVGNRHNKSYQYAAACNLSNVAVSKSDVTRHLVYVYGNSGDNDGYKNGQWIGATLTYDAMTFSRSGGVDMHVNKANNCTQVHRPEMLLNANEWYKADTQQKIADLLDYGATNIRLENDLNLEANDASGYTVINKDIRIGLDGHTITINSKGLKIAGNAEVKFQNGVVLMNQTVAPEALSVNGNYAVEVGEFCNLELEAVKLYANRSGVYLNGKAASLDMSADSAIYACGYYGIGTNVNGSKDFGVIINIKYSKVFAGLSEFTGLNGVTPVNKQTDSNKYGVAVLLNVPGTLKAEKTSLLSGYTHGLILREGTAVVNNSVIEVTGSNANLDKYKLGNTNHEAWGKGYNVPSAAVTLGTYQTTADGTGTNYLYQNATEVILTNVTLKKSAGSEYICMHNDNTKANTTLTFDTFTAWKSLGETNKNGELVTKCSNNENDKLTVWDEREFSAE